MNSIIEEIIKEAYNEEVIIDHDKFNIAFNTILNGNEFIKNDLYPTLKINDFNTFSKKLDEYIRVFLKHAKKLPTFVTDRERNLVKVLITYIFCNATTEEFNDPIKLIQSKINYLEDKTFENLDETYDGFIEGSTINVKNVTQTLYMETPYKMEMTLTKDEDIYHFPSISYGISDNECYIYAIQNKKFDNDTFTKKINRQLYKLNKNVNKDLLEVTPNAIVSLSIFLELLKKHGITKIHAVPYLPVRFYSRELALQKIEEEKKKLLEERNELIKKNSTEKFIRTFNRVNSHTNSMDIDFDLNENLDATLKESNINNQFLNSIIENTKTK